MLHHSTILHWAAGADCFEEYFAAADKQSSSSQSFTQWTDFVVSVLQNLTCSCAIVIFPSITLHNSLYNFISCFIDAEVQSDHRHLQCWTLNIFAILLRNCAEFSRITWKPLLLCTKVSPKISFGLCLDICRSERHGCTTPRFSERGAASWSNIFLQLAANPCPTSVAMCR